VTGTAPTLLRTRLKSFSLEKFSIADDIQQNHHIHHHHMSRTVCTMCFSMVQTAIDGAIEEKVPFLRTTDDHIGLV